MQLRTCQIHLVALLDPPSGDFYELLQAFVVDVFRGPLRDLVSREISTKLHGGGLDRSADLAAMQTNDGNRKHQRQATDALQMSD